MVPRITVSLISHISTVPNLTLVAPKDGNELRAVLHHTLEHHTSGIVAVRYPRDAVPTPMEEPVGTIQWGTWEWLTEPGQVVLLAVGTMVPYALSAAERLAEHAIDVSVVNARFVKPFDMMKLEQIRRQAKMIVTLEEGAIRGGFGQAVAEYLLSSGYEGKFKALAMPDSFVTHGNRAQLLKDVGLDAVGIYNSLTEFISHQSKADSNFLQRLVNRIPGPLRRKDVFKRVE